MKLKPITPYQRLLGEIREWAHKVRNRHTVEMFYYPKAKIGEAWNLADLYERTKAAEQLGYDVQLMAKDTGLHVKYVKALPDVPFNFEY